MPARLPRTPSKGALERTFDFSMPAPVTSKRTDPEADVEDGEDYVSSDEEEPDVRDGVRPETHLVRSPQAL